MMDRYPADHAVVRPFQVCLFRLESATFETEQFAALILMFIGLGMDSAKPLAALCSGRNRDDRVNDALDGLSRAGYICPISEQTGGRPSVHYKLADKGNEWWTAAATPELLQVAQSAALRMPVEITPPGEPVETRQQQVYLFHKRTTTLYKIGTSVDIQRRLKQLSPGHENLLYCAAHMDGGFELESHLQSLNFGLRLGKTEWFRFKSHDRAIKAFLQKEPYHREETRGV